MGSNEQLQVRHLLQPAAKAALIAAAASLIFFTGRWLGAQLPLPTPVRQVPIFGHLFPFLRYYKEPFILLDHWFRRFRTSSSSPRTVVGYQMWIPRVVTIDPEVIRELTTTKFEQFEKGEATFSAIRPLFGKGIFAVNGEEWRGQREAMTPLFHRSSLAAMVPCFVSHAAPAIDRALSETATAGRVDIQAVMRAYTMGTFMEVGLGARVPADVADKFAAAFDFMSATTATRLIFGPLAPIFVGSRAYNQARRLCDDVIHRYVLGAEAEAVKQHAVAPDGEALDVVRRFRGRISAEQLRDVVTNFLFAGRDTTACLLTFTLWALALYPDVRAKVEAELAAAGLMDPAAELTYDALWRLEYLKAVLNESLRLFPPVPVDGYETRVPTRIAGVSLPVGTTVWYTSWTLHRDEAIFGPRPLEYDPSRWATIKPSAVEFVPFHAGKRVCLGQQMAYIEAKAMLVSLLRRAVPQPVAATPKAVDEIKYAYQIILGAESMPIALVPRK